MKFGILLCLFGVAAASAELRVARDVVGLPVPGASAAADASAALSGSISGGGPLPGGLNLDEAKDLIKETSREKVSDYVPYLPPDPYDLSKVDQSKLGTISKILTSVVDLVRGIVKGLEASVTSIYTVLIPTVRIVLAGAKVKVCQPQSLTEILVWFVKELVNVQLYADIALAQIPLCQQKKEELNPDGSDLSVWNITYEVPDTMKSGQQQAAEASAAAAGEEGLLDGSTALPGLGGAAIEASAEASAGGAPPAQSSGAPGEAGPKTP